MTRPLLLLVAALALTWPLLVLSAHAAPLPPSADNAAAIEAAIDACKNGPCEIELDAAEYVVTRPINICAPVTISGVGSGYKFSATILSSKRKTIFRTWKAAQCPRGKVARDGEMTLQRVVLSSTPILKIGQVYPGEAPFYGVEVHATVVIDDVGIAGFTHGVHMECDTPTDKSNCNHSLLRSVAAINNAHAGIWLAGDNANAGLLERVRVDKNCQAGAAWSPSFIALHCSKWPLSPVCSNPHFMCDGIVDNSYLGTTVVASMAHEEYGHGGYAVWNPNARTTFVGAYGESNTWPQLLSSESNVVGGVGTWTGGLGRWQGSGMPGLTLGNGDVALHLGSSTRRQGSAWIITGPGDRGTWPWGMGLGKDGQLELRIDAKTVGVQPWVKP